LTIGRPIWGLRFPSKEGWTEIAAERSERHGPSDDIDMSHCAQYCQRK